MTRGILPTQLAMLFGARERVGAEVQQVVVALPNDVTLERVREAFERVSRRHPILWTTFPLVDGEFVPTTHAPTPVPWIEHASSAPLARAMTELRARDRATPLDVSQTPVFRLQALRAADGSAVLWTFHHAHLDGRSIERVLEEVVSIVLGRPVESPPADPAVHVTAALDEDHSRAGRTHLAEALAELREPTPMPIGPSREAGDRERHVRIRPEVLLPLATLGERFQFTWATVMHVAWALVLAQRANRGDVVFGSTRACRNLVPESRDAVGCLINTVPFFVALDPRERVVELMARVRSQSIALREAETLGLAEAASVCGVRAADLVRTILVCEGHTLQERMRSVLPEARGWSFTLYGQSSAPLTVAVYRTADGGADVVFEAEPTRVDVSQLARIADDFVAWIDEIARLPFARVAELRAPGRPAVLLGGRPSAPETVTASLRGSREHHPDRVAVKSAASAQQLTYRELWLRAEGLAARLASAGARPGDHVAVGASRAVDTVVAFVATQLAGLVYVPIDPRHPDERKRFVLEDCGARYWLGPTFGALPSSVRCLDPPTIATDASVGFVPPPVDPEHVSYLLYTSGSTGHPKGVKIPHRALAAHSRAAIATYALTPEDRVLQFASASFDVYLEEVVPTLVAGGTVVVRDDAAADSFDALLSTLARERITVFQSPTALFNELSDELARRARALPSCVRLVVIGGERANAGACRRFRSVEPELRLVNAYGPTEVTITSVVHDVPRDVREPIPIGRPFGACEAFVLDWRGRTASVGVRGELVLGGPQVALGYHGREETTAAKFVADPRVDGSEGDRGRVYRTGDVVYVDTDDRLVFEGRLDDQVKVRGVRIELGEVERALQRDPAVAEAVAKLVTPPSGEPFLAAFVVLSDPKSTEEALRRRLHDVLPAASVPARIVIVPALPRSVGGKIDRGALEARLVPRDAVDLSDASAVELRIAQAFAEVLETPAGLDDDFFDLGGNSLRALRVVSRLAVGETKPTVATLVAHPTPRALASWFESSDAATPAPVDELVRLNDVPSGPTPLYGVVGLHLYTTIARALTRPVFGVFLPDEVAFAERTLRVSTLASRYVEAIERRTGAPPKLLAGFSFGAIVAFEMAQQLQARGQRPDLIVLLDPRLPSMIERRPLDPLLDLVAVARRDRRDAAEHLVELVGRKLRRFRDRVADGERPKLADERRAEDRSRAYADALERYEPGIRPYDGRALIYLARDESPGRLDEVEATWRRLVAPSSQIVVVEGTHGVLLTEPFVQRINGPLSALLRTRPSVAFARVGDDEK